MEPLGFSGLLLFLVHPGGFAVLGVEGAGDGVCGLLVAGSGKMIPRAGYQLEDAATVGLVGLARICPDVIFVKMSCQIAGSGAFPAVLAEGLG